MGVGSWGVDRREMRAGENCGGQRGGGRGGGLTWTEGFGSWGWMSWSAGWDDCAAPILYAGGGGGGGGDG